MSTDQPNASLPSEPLQAPQSRGMRAVWRRWRRGHKHDERGEATPALPSPGSGVDIVDQAEVFKTLRVSDVMTPRADIMAIDISTAFEEVVRQFAEVEHSRMPVYR
ncbi:MAG: HlyC/CorC family transporter, partial [Caulobacteraceae bacterium]|nr:HlyC/CorC family transporter [Caulobacteraceae bacterium]